MDATSDVSTTSVCFSHRDFKIYMFLLMCLLSYIIYVLYQKDYDKREKMTNVDLMSHLQDPELRARFNKLQDAYHKLLMAQQQCLTDLEQSKKSKQKQTYFDPSQSMLLKQYLDFQKRYSAPERPYPGGTFNTPRVDDDSYGLIGYVYQDGGNERYPLFGRYKYPGRSDKWEYYIMDETRNRLKIPFKNTNDNELYDNDTVSIPSVGSGYKVKLYEYENFRYNPNNL